MKHLEDVKIDIISILKGIYANNLTAKADANLVITNDGIKGYVDFDIYNGSYYDLKRLTIGNTEEEE